MKTCKCSGNNSLRSGIGRTLCDCGGKLNLRQILKRIVARLDEADDMDSHMIDGLVVAGLGECDSCGGWFTESALVRAGDRAVCPKCFDPAFLIREDDDDNTVEKLVCDLFKSIRGGKINSYHEKPYLDLLPKDRNGKLEEPFLTEYLKYARFA